MMWAEIVSECSSCPYFCHEGAGNLCSFWEQCKRHKALGAGLPRSRCFSFQEVSHLKPVPWGYTGLKIHTQFPVVRLLTFCLHLLSLYPAYFHTSLWCSLFYQPQEGRAESTEEGAHTSDLQIAVRVCSIPFG